METSNCCITSCSYQWGLIRRNSLLFLFSKNDVGLCISSNNKSFLGKKTISQTVITAESKFICFCNFLKKHLRVILYKKNDLNGNTNIAMLTLKQKVLKPRNWWAIYIYLYVHIQTHLGAGETAFAEFSYYLSKNVNLKF